MYFTNPTLKPHVVDVNASQQEALQSLVDAVDVRNNEILHSPHKTILLRILCSLYNCIACVVTLTPIDANDVDALEISMNKLIDEELYMQMGHAAYNSITINKVHVYNDEESKKISFRVGLI